MIAVLRERSIPEGEQDELVSIVKLRAWKMPGDTPDDLEGWKSRCRMIAKSASVDEIRKWLTHARTNAGSTDIPDDYPDPKTEESSIAAPDRAKIRSVIPEIIERAKLPAQTLAVVQARATGASGAEAARQENISERQANRLWTNFVVHAKKHPVLLALAAVTAYLGIANRSAFVPDPVAHHDPTPPVVDAGIAPQPTAPPSPPPEVLVDETQKRADALLLEIDDAIKNKKWGLCELDLNRLVLIHPVDDRVKVQKIKCDEGFTRDNNVKRGPGH